METNAILRLEGTTDTPEVILNAELCTLSITGNCYPENAFQFFKPLLDWMKNNHTLFKGPAKAEIKLNYFNSSSGRFLLKFLNICSHQLSNGLTVMWLFESGDELIKERGEELASAADVSFVFVEL